MTEKQRKVFFEIHSDSPREGPGSNNSTRKAFSFIKNVSPSPAILDIGCGPGAQTMCLAEIAKGEITAVDNHKPFIDELKKNVEKAGLQKRVRPIVADMCKLDFEPDSFDCIWAEGCIYIIGVEKGLNLWKPFLKKNGIVAFTEVSWLRDDIPEEVERFWKKNYPSISDIRGNIERIQKAGYELIDHFVLPEIDWWSQYYYYIEKKLETLDEKYRDDEEAYVILQMEKEEINLYSRYSDYYGYVFYITRKKQ